MPIYRARIKGKPVPILPTWELTGGGLMPPPEARLTLALSKRPPLRPFIGPRLPEGWASDSIEAASTETPTTVMQ
jgi:soluble lytic murein transglycosylase